MEIDTSFQMPNEQPSSEKLFKLSYSSRPNYNHHNFNRPNNNGLQTSGPQVQIGPRSLPIIRKHEED